MTGAAVRVGSSTISERLARENWTDESAMIAADSAVRRPGRVQGLVLITAPMFSLLGAVLIAPMLSVMLKEFRDTPHAETLVPLLLTAPALLLACLAPVAGILGDRFGYRRLLLTSLVLYGVTGMAPLLLSSLAAILLSRLLLGVAEAGLVTAAMVLLGSYFSGDERQKWIAYQGVATPWCGAGIIAASGVLGSLNWRYVFAMYGLSLVIFLVGLFAIKNPAEYARPGGRDAAVSHDTPSNGDFTRFSWKVALLIGGIAIPGSIAFYLGPTQLSFLLEATGHPDPRAGATATAIALLISPLAAYLTRKFTHLNVGTVLGFGFLMIALGLASMALGTTIGMITAGYVVQQMGGGIMLITAINYVLGLSAPQDRGKFSGFWWFIYTLAQFFAPLVVVGLHELFGGTAPAILATSVLLVVFSAWLFMSEPLACRVVVRARA